jgi:hypothetical protein
MAVKLLAAQAPIDIETPTVVADFGMLRLSMGYYLGWQ